MTAATIMAVAAAPAPITASGCPDHHHGRRRRCSLPPQSRTLSTLTVGKFPSVLLRRRFPICSATPEDSVPLSKINGGVPPAKRSSFPPGFLFGTATSSYQTEGAVGEGGKGLSNWDFYTAKYPNKIKDSRNGNVTVDGYHRYKEDVALMKSLGFNAYRFSISWARILPNGTVDGGVNEEGITYYNNLIDELIANGIEPFVTIFHFDLPQALEYKYKGFLNREIVEDFVGYADVCFNRFGDRVKYWVPVNEPLSYCLFGYTNGTMAPGRPLEGKDLKYAEGDASIEPYIVGHNILLSHAATVKLYREKYQSTQKGVIGTAQVFQWGVPLSDSKEDKEAAERRLDFTFGWFQEPLLTGDYPKSMRDRVGNRLDNFTEEESKMLKDSFDFVGLNYYTAYYISNAPLLPNPDDLSPLTDSHTNFSSKKNNEPIGPQAGLEWQNIYPQGIRDGVLEISKKYKNTPIYITENGMADDTLSFNEALNDTQRVDFHRKHIDYLNDAIKYGKREGGRANVKGYFVWSLMDNFEWSEGYTVRFGINCVNFEKGLMRHPKKSALWFRNFLKND